MVATNHMSLFTFVLKILFVYLRNSERENEVGERQMEKERLPPLLSMETELGLDPKTYGS